MNEDVLREALQVVNLLETTDQKDSQFIIIVLEDALFQVLLHDDVRIAKCPELLICEEGTLAILQGLDCCSASATIQDSDLTKHVATPQRDLMSLRVFLLNLVVFIHFI